VNYGLRYDVEHLSQYEGLSYGSDRNNVGRRFAMSYDVTGEGKTLLKVNNGLYYDRIFQNPITPTFFQAKTVLQQYRASGTSASLELRSLRPDPSFRRIQSCERRLSSRRRARSRSRYGLRTLTTK
jgi:hypothetical protein